MKMVYIAGASSRARTAKAYIEYVEAGTKVAAFLVSPEMEDNPEEVDGVPVLSIGEGLEVSLPVYIGTRGVNHEKLAGELSAVGFTDIIPINMQLDMELRNAYLEKWYAEHGMEFERMDMLAGEEIASVKIEAKITMKSAAIYVASSIYDGVLKDAYTPIEQERTLQVGAALSSKRLSETGAVDCVGENISEKNKQFCELTGLYWIWKNAKEDYVGLAHYRRHFLLPEKWMEIVTEHDIDVILPVPLYVAPSIKENYRERHDATDWDYVEQYIKEHIPEEYDGFLRIMGGNLYSPCNMVIAKKEVFDELCTWLFPILLAAVEHGGTKDDKYQNRYPGFLSERLITYFFESRREKYKVVYCNKNFLA